MNQEFTAHALHKHWAEGPTEYVIGESGRLYLAAVLDLFSGFVVDWAVSGCNDSIWPLKRSRWG